MLQLRNGKGKSVTIGNNSHDMSKTGMNKLD